MAGTMDSAEARAEDARITVVQVAAGEAHTLALTGAFKVNPRGWMYALWWSITIIEREV